MRPATLSKDDHIPWSGSGRWELLFSRVVPGVFFGFYWFFLMGVWDQFTSIDVMEWLKKPKGRRIERAGVEFVMLVKYNKNEQILKGRTRNLA